RADIRAAQIVSAVYGAQGVKVPLNDALLQWGQEQTENASDPFAGLENAFLMVSQ
uniref:phage tail assembly protein T n=1 Tax=Escherichia coli TaxID=562 RepID=UPI000D08626B